MHIHVLGIGGTFMGSLALLAQQLGHRVTGCDRNVYPPMSDLLQANGVRWIEGYAADQLALGADCYVIGNALSRGNPLIEAILDQRLPYYSGPAWLSQEVLMQRWVLAVAGTHGKTTTTSLLLHVLKLAGLAPGFLVGGAPLGEDRSADKGLTDFFVIEADEYDTAFFDKRSKFVHYHPNTLVLNNLEFDHADIFPDLAAIQKQFCHLMRVVPRNGLIVCPQDSPSLEAVLAQDCWTPVSRVGISTQTVAGRFWAKLLSEDGSHFAIYAGAVRQGEVRWESVGQHNVMNALAAVLAARHVGVPPGFAIEALGTFAGVKRRLESLGQVRGVEVFDDFAHHPTAIATTLHGMRARLERERLETEQPRRLLVVIEPRSSSMKSGCLGSALADAVREADRVWWFEPPDLTWDLRAAVSGEGVSVYADTQHIIDRVVCEARVGDRVVVMSNGGFEGLHKRLLAALALDQSSSVA
ncbi:MAG: UDP-N-acetylmuramate:L-alanyl-gamma-D-glutamyl-meso-diaminopimelate ligase [Gammaproteobacteria bacterium]